jgi:hypothetical protein
MPWNHRRMWEAAYTQPDPHPTFRSTAVRHLEYTVSHILRQPSLEAGCDSACLWALCSSGKDHREKIL